MNIAIFGCSFACMQSNHGMKSNFNSKGRPWMQILNEDFNYNITNYGYSGSSMYYSYSKFKENYKNFDRIIFLGTYPDRKYSPNFKNFPHILIAFASPEKMPSHATKDEHELIRDYYTYIHNVEEADNMKELMVNDIKNLCGDKALYIDVPTTIANVTKMERLSGFIEQPADNRWCHISNENNYIFASQINNWLIGNPFIFDLASFKKPTAEELKSYYVLT